MRGIGKSTSAARFADTVIDLSVPECQKSRPTGPPGTCARRGPFPVSEEPPAKDGTGCTDHMRILLVHSKIEDSAGVSKAS